MRSLALRPGSLGVPRLRAANQSSCVGEQNCQCAPRRMETRNGRRSIALRDYQLSAPTSSFGRGCAACAAHDDAGPAKGRHMPLYYSRSCREGAEPPRPPGRYRGEDTARVRFIDGWIMPLLLRGKCRRSTTTGCSSSALANAAQARLAAWARDVNNRSASSAEELANPAYAQQTLQCVLTRRRRSCRPR